MGIFDWLTGRQDPTKNWGDARPPMPAFDVSRMRFGTIALGNPLDTLAGLGKPDQFHGKTEKYCELLYASAGFQINCDAGRIDYLAFFIGPDEYAPSHPAMKFSEPRLVGIGRQEIRLTRETNQAMLENLFGEPAHVDADEDETILFYKRNDIAMEFELQANNGTLKRWNIYKE